MYFEFSTKLGSYQLCLICILIISVNCLHLRNTPYCGLQKFKPQISNYNEGYLRGRIVGGVKAQEGEFPWIVSLQNKSKGKFQHFCGGTIISDYYILTAAHCAQDLIGFEHNLRIKIGTSDLKKPGIVIGIDKIILHRFWDKNNYINDIALYKTKYPIKYRQISGKYSVNNICLPLAIDKIQKDAIVAGWGKLGKGIYPTDLQKLEVPLYPQKDCKIRFENLGTVTDMMVCYGGQGNKDSCQGDSGGPLVVKEGPKFTLIGIVSYGVPCAVKDYPTIYTKVANYLDWIEDQIIIK